MTMTKIQIAEDEPLMRERLLAQLTQLWPDAQIVAASENGNDAWDHWLEHEPDVVFLDIQMPGIDGLDLAQRIGRRSHIIFVTAYDQYAVAAFERGAADYLLKPVDVKRLDQTIGRIKLRLQQSTQTLEPVLEEIRQSRTPVATQYLKWLKASVGKQIRLINVDDILFLQSDTKYTRIATNNGEALVRIALKDLLGNLDPDRFWQIHRSTIVNVHAIEAAERLDNERLEVLIKGSPEKLAVSRAFVHLFRD